MHSSNDLKGSAMSIALFSLADASISEVQKDSGSKKPPHAFAGILQRLRAHGLIEA